MECKSKRNAGFFRIAFGGCQSGVRNADYQICIHRIGFGQRRPAPDPGFIDTDSVQAAVQPGKIDVFENTMGMFGMLRNKLRVQFSVFCYSYNFTRLYITNELGADRCDGTAFGSDDVGVVPFSDA